MQSNRDPLFFSMARGGVAILTAVISQSLRVAVPKTYTMNPPPPEEELVFFPF